MKKFLLIPILFLLSFSIKSQVNWAEDISCILYTNCTSCHNPDGIAPFSLLTYNDAFAFRYAIQNAVNAGTMPPHPPDSEYQTYIHQRVLDPADITAINDWVNAGGMEGDPNIAPPIPSNINGEIIESPDYSFTLDAYTSTATTNDEYRCFVVSNPYNTTQYIQGIEVVPGNRNIVHHALVFVDNASGPPNWDNGNGYTCFGSTNSNSSRLITSYAPGQGADFYPTGMGIKLAPNDYFIVQVHFPKGSAGEVDATKVNLKMTSTPQREITVDFILNYFSSLTNGPIYLPPETVKTYYAEYTIPIDVTVYNVFPHMHLIGKSIKVYGVTPTNDTIRFVDIPDWDFDWQSTYFFENPIKVPAGTVLHGVGVYDNTSSNPNNPSSPPQTVTAGESTTDEMFIAGFAYSFYLNGDETIVQGDIGFTNYCDTVSTTVGIFDVEQTVELEIFPVPTRNHLQVNAQGLIPGEEVTITIYDMVGRKVYDQQFTSQGLRFNQGLDIHQLNGGMYSLKIEANGKTGWEKFVKVE